MTRLIAQINVTPDGFCNHDAVIADDDFMAFAAALVEEADVLLLGRHSHDLFAAHWPQAAQCPDTGPAEARLARAIDGTQRIVASRRMKSSVWPGTTILPEMTEHSLTDLIAGQNALLLGSPSIVSQLAGWDLIDRYIFSVHPLLAGAGVRMFNAGEASGLADFQLSGTTPQPSGVNHQQFDRPIPEGPQT